MDIKGISKKYNLNKHVTKLFHQRNLTSKEQIEDFLSPSLSNMNDLTKIPNISTVVNTIKDHIFLGKIIIFCDFDCDGLTSAAIMFKAIKNYEPNANVLIINSNRYRDEYSLSNEAIHLIKKQNPTLVITLDCGISSRKEILKLKEKGIEVVVIDHHESGEKIDFLENKFIDLKVNAGNYGFQEFSAGGITWRVCQALLNSSFKEVLDLVTVSTVADVVPLIGENRYIAHAGINAIKQKNVNPGIKALASVLDLSLNTINTSDIGFLLGPCINAIGRLGSPRGVLDLFLYEHRQSQLSIDNIAFKLKEINERRKRLANKIFDNMVATIDNDVNVVVVRSRIKRGIVGPIASKINKRFLKPTVVVDTESGKGSARSIEPFNIFKNLKICKQEGLLDTCGGHKMAAGLKVKEGKFHEFSQRLNELAEDVEYKVNKYDLEIPLQEVDHSFLNDMYKLKPFGHKNRHPIIKSHNIEINRPYVIKDRHVKFKANDKEAIAFYVSHQMQHFKAGNKLTLLYQPKLSTFRKKGKIELIIQDIIKKNE